MNIELEKKLIEKYPELFRDMYGDPQKTCLAFGIECGDGWYDLIDNICHIIKQEIDNRERAIRYAKTWNKDTLNPDSEYFCREDKEVPDPIEVTITQIKEKLGTLRFYYNGGTDYIHGAVQMAENMSAHICEVCGERGSISRGPWLKTLCEKHNS